MTTIRDWLRRQGDVDQLLIFFLLAVTVSQMGYYLASFQPWGLWWVGYLQALAVDAAIWRSAWWYRRYRGRKQRRWALAGVVAFSLVSAWYNFGFYTMQREAMRWPLRLAMGAVLPAGVALLSFLKGQKDESAFAVKEKEPKPERASRITDERVQLAIDAQRALAGTDLTFEEVAHTIIDANRRFMDREQAVMDALTGQETFVIRSYSDFARAVSTGELDPDAMTGDAVGIWAGVSASTGRRWLRQWANGSHGDGL